MNSKDHWLFYFFAQGFVQPHSTLRGKITIITLYNYKFYHIFHFKGTVSVVSSDPPCKDGNARFTTVPLTPKSDLNVVFLIRKVCISVSSLQLLRKKGNVQVSSQRNRKWKLTILRNKNMEILFILDQTKFLRVPL